MGGGVGWVVWCPMGLDLLRCGVRVGIGRVVIGAGTVVEVAGASACSVPNVLEEGAGMRSVAVRPSPSARGRPRAEGLAVATSADEAPAMGCGERWELLGNPGGLGEVRVRVVVLRRRVVRPFLIEGRLRGG